MKRKARFIARRNPTRDVAVAMFLLLTVAMTSRADQFDTLRLYWQNYLLTYAIAPPVLTNVVITPSFSGGGHFFVNNSRTNIQSTASNYWSTLNTNSSRTYLWSDLPFGSVSANVTLTFDRLQMMSLAWAMPGSSLQGNPALVSTVTNCLDWMNTKIYTSTASRYDNWFNWVISGPESLVHSMTLVYPVLTSMQISNYCAAIDNFSPGGAHATPAPSWMTGANTSELVLMMSLRGIVGKDGSRITTATNHVGPVFPFVTSGDGFYADGSYVFHNNLAYNGNYGMGCLADMAVLGPLLNGSAWQITDLKLTNVFDWVFNAYEPFIYNGALMDMIRGRSTSFQSSTEYVTGANVLSYIQQIAQFAPPATAVQMSNFVSAPMLSPRQLHFANMDRVLALRSGFAFGIAMSSTRIANYESINGNNLHGWFTGDGMAYLYVGNVENQFNGNFWATVDPYHLPGTTEQTNALANSANEGVTSGQNWVGGAQVAGTYGVAGMSFHAAATTLYGKKSWFMLDNEIVCLGAGITSGDASGVHTTAENRRLATPLTNSFTLNGVAITPTTGWSSNLSSATPSWCALGGTGGYYFPAGNSNLQATFTANSGSWTQINTQAGTVSDPSVFTDNFLKLWLNHGAKPTNATYAYVLLPGMDASSVSNYALNPDIIILTNTASIQAVKKPALGVVAANFWTNGVSAADLISVNSKASVITWETSTNIFVGIADPTQTNTSSITVTLNRAATGLLSADAGVTVVQLAPQIILSVNVSGTRGKSFQAALQLDQVAVTPPPVVALVSPATNSIFLNSTNVNLLLSATASNPVPTNVMTTVWNQTSGPGTIIFGNSNALTTTANFSADGIYGITFTASNGATASVSLTVAVNTLSSPPTNGLLDWWKLDETGGTTAFDSSGNSANALVSGVTFTTGYLSNALRLTGGNNNASFTAADTTQITVAGWVKANSSGGTSFPYILGNPGFHLVFRMDGSANNNTFDLATHTTAGGTAVNGEWVSPPSSISLGAWYHVAFSYDKSSIVNVPALYLNGVKMSLTTLKSPTVATPTYAGASYLGNRFDLIRGWDGWIDDLRIYNRILSDAEVQTLAGAASLPNLAPLVSAGANQTVVWPASANLTGNVSDDGQPNPPGAVTVAWSKVSGPGTISFANSNALATAASFSAAGNYQLQLATTDGQVTTASQIAVTVVTRPNVSVEMLPGAIQLSWPVSNGNWQLQYQTNASAAGLGTSWLNVPGPTTNPIVVPINSSVGAAFYRLLLITN